MTDTPITGLSVSVYTIPTDAPEADGTAAWDSTTMVLVRVRAGGREGLGWTYGPAACAAVVHGTLAGCVIGRDAMDIGGSFAAMLAAVRNQGASGVCGYAISAVDIALWDLKARLLGLPLHRLLGVVRESAPVYGSGGFTTYDADRLHRQLDGWVAGEGIPRVKIKIGESWGTRPDRDLERIGQARAAIGDAAELFVDANGGYTAKQAIRIAGAARDAGVVWWEEPVSSDDLQGLAQVRAAIDADVAAGEYGWGPAYFRRMCAAGAVDCLQADATRCGGITGWTRAAVVAQAHGLELSGHCAPHAHVQAAVSIPNLRHLEWFHDHVRIEDLFFDGTLPPNGGQLRPDPDAPGLGLVFREADARPYEVGAPG